MVLPGGGNARRLVQGPACLGEGGSKSGQRPPRNLAVGEVGGGM